MQAAIAYDRKAEQFVIGEWWVVENTKYEIRLRRTSPKQIRMTKIESSKQKIDYWKDSATENTESSIVINHW